MAAKLVCSSPLVARGKGNDSNYLRDESLVAPANLQLGHCYRPLGLVDNASDFESEDCGLESRMGGHWRNNAPNLGHGLVFVPRRKCVPVLVGLIHLSKLDSAQKQIEFDLKHSGCIVWKHGPSRARAGN